MKKALIIILISFSAVAGWSQNTSKTKVFESYKEMVTSAKNEIEEISVTDFHKMYATVLSFGGTDFTLIDIRTETEYNDGFIPGAFLVQRGVLESHLEKDEVWEAFDHARPKKSDLIVLYCRSGSRSALAAKSLKMLGYSHIKSLESGWRAWSEKYPNLKK